MVELVAVDALVDICDVAEEEPESKGDDADADADADADIIEAVPEDTLFEAIGSVPAVVLDGATPLLTLLVKFLPSQNVLKARLGSCRAAQALTSNMQARNASCAAGVLYVRGHHVHVEPICIEPLFPQQCRACHVGTESPSE